MAKQDDFVRYTIRVPADLYARIQDAAGVRSVNAEIVERLAASFTQSHSSEEFLEVRQAWTEAVALLQQMEKKSAFMELKIEAVADAAARNAVQEMMALHPEIKEPPSRFEQRTSEKPRDVSIDLQIAETERRISELAERLKAEAKGKSEPARVKRKLVIRKPKAS